MAMQTAVGKERFKYYCGFVGLCYTVCPIIAAKTRNIAPLIPLVPLTIMWLWQYDTFYGNLMIRAQREAALTMKEEPERFFLPQGTGIVDQAKYNQIIGQPENYKMKLDPQESVFSVMGKSLSGKK